MTNDYLAVDQYMGSVFAQLGFVRDGVDDNLEYGGRPAWAVYYRGDDCKVQVCWSAREGGIDFMLAPLGAPNELGLADPSKTWRFLLLLSDFDDGLKTPNLGDQPDVWWKWRVELFEAHFPAAHAALLRG